MLWSVERPRSSRNLSLWKCTGSGVRDRCSGAAGCTVEATGSRQAQGRGQRCELCSCICAEPVRPIPRSSDSLALGFLFSGGPRRLSVVGRAFAARVWPGWQAHRGPGRGLACRLCAAGSRVCARRGGSKLTPYVFVLEALRSNSGRIIIATGRERQQSLGKGHND